MALLGGKRVLAPHLHVESGQETLLAVALGAALATIGGFLAGQFERFIHGRERQRNAALMFGEILAGLRLLVDLAHESRQRGEPYGRVTERMIRAAQRETDTYSRNREILYDVRDATLRAQIHSLLVRMTLAIDGVLSSYAAIDAATGGVGAAGAVTPSGDLVLKSYMDDRAFAFDYAVELAGEIKPILKRLNRVAHFSFEDHEAYIRRSAGL